MTHTMSLFCGCDSCRIERQRLNWAYLEGRSTKEARRLSRRLLRGCNASVVPALLAITLTQTHVAGK